MDCKAMSADNYSLEGTMEGNNVEIKANQTWNVNKLECDRLDIYGCLDAKDEPAMLRCNQIIVHSTGFIKSNRIFIKPFDNNHKDTFMKVEGHIICQETMLSTAIKEWKIEKSVQIE